MEELVYLVVFQWYDEYFVHGVFKTEKDAIAALERYTDATSSTIRYRWEGFTRVFRERYSNSRTDDPWYDDGLFTIVKKVVGSWED